MTTSPTIRRIVLPESGRPKPTPRPATVPVMVELHSDGYVVVYGPRHLRVVVVQRLVDDDHPGLATAVDEYVALSLPRSHRAVYTSQHVRATGLVRRRTVEQERDRLHRLELVQTLGEVGKELRRSRRATQ